MLALGGGLAVPRLRPVVVLLVVELGLAHVARLRTLIVRLVVVELSLAHVARLGLVVVRPVVVRLVVELRLALVAWLGPLGIGLAHGIGLARGIGLALALVGLPLDGAAASASAAARSALGLRCGLAGRLDRDAALVAIAGALGPHTPVIGQGHVDHPPLGGQHRLEGHGLAGGGHTLGRTGGELTEVGEPPVAVPLDVDDHGGGVFPLPAQDHVRHELERSERVPTAADDETCVLALHVDDRRVVRAAAGAADGRLSFDVEELEYVSDDAETGAGACSGPADEGDADLGILRADAEDAGTASANDVDLDFVSADAELEER